MGGASPLAPVLTCPGRDDPGMRRFLDAAARALGASVVELDLEVAGAAHPRRYRRGDGRPRHELPLGAPPRFRAVLRHDGGAADGLGPILGLALEQLLEAGWLAYQVRLTREALDITTSAIFLFDASGDIVYANPPGDRILERQTSAPLEVEVDGRRLPLVNHICALVERLGRGRDTTRITGRQALPDGSELCWEVIPLPGPGEGGHPTVAVIRHVAVRPLAALHRVSVQFALSRREREVLAELVRTENTAEIARALGISVHTVRDHLKRLYRKTGSRSRRELVRLVEAEAAGAE